MGIIQDTQFIVQTLSVEKSFFFFEYHITYFHLPLSYPHHVGTVRSYLKLSEHLQKRGDVETGILIMDTKKAYIGLS